MADAERTERQEAPKSEFVAKLEARWQKGNFVCVGLDSDYSKIPQHLKDRRTVWEPILSFNINIVESTHNLVCAYKPNIAFYEAHGKEGWIALHGTITYIKERYPDIPVILDAKRADIGNTNNGYVKMAFDELHADAVTVHPYLGQEALQPFLDRKDKGIVVLVRTSNPRAGEFQDLPISLDNVGDDDAGLLVNAMPEGTNFDKVPLWAHVAAGIALRWNKNGNCAVVVGATYPGELRIVRKIVGDMPILLPGIGAQGAKVEATVKAGRDSRNQGMIINSSREIIFASSGEDFAEAARREAQKLNDEINKYRLVA